MKRTDKLICCWKFLLECVLTRRGLSSCCWWFGYPLNTLKRLYANDTQKIFAFIRRCIRTGFCSPDLADFHDLYISSNEKLFNKILTYPNHILRTLLPPPTAQNYSLGNRSHNRQLLDRISRITNCNFTVRMLYRNVYWLFVYLRPALCFIPVYNCGLTVRNKRICYVMWYERGLTVSPIGHRCWRPCVYLEL